MKITVDAKGIDVISAKLRGLQDKQISVAAVAALNDAAYLAAKETSSAIAKVFDRPTPWVLGGVRYNKARPDKPESSVDFDKWGNKTNVTVENVLRAQIFSGARKHKRHEVALMRAGILPPGMYIVPGQAAEIDQYGNMKSSQIVQIMAFFRSFGEQGYRANTTDKRKAALLRGTKKNNGVGFEYFAVQPGEKRTFVRASGKTGTHKMQPGIYARYITGFGSAIRPMMIFVKQPAYKKRLDFYGIAEKAAVKEFNRAFPVYLNKLLAERGL